MGRRLFERNSNFRKIGRWQKVTCLLHTKLLLRGISIHQRKRRAKTEMGNLQAPCKPYIADSFLKKESAVRYFVVLRL